MTSAPITAPEALEPLLLRGPFHRWLGLQIIAVAETSLTLRATWREEWVVNPERRHTHGGILAALVDLTADWAIGVRLGRGLPTVDLRVDYHRPALPGDLLCHGTVVQLGGRLAVGEARILGLDGTLLASGRGVYLAAPPRA